MLLINHLLADGRIGGPNVRWLAPLTGDACVTTTRNFGPKSKSNILMPFGPTLMPGQQNPHRPIINQLTTLQNQKEKFKSTYRLYSFPPRSICAICKLCNDSGESCPLGIVRILEQRTIEGRVSLNILNSVALINC